MNSASSEQKTAVFAPVSGSRETRSYPVMDEDTRELPLIADRFAGRYWDGRAEEPKAKKPRRRSRALSTIAAVLAAAMLFFGLLFIAGLDQSAAADTPTAETAAEMSAETADSITVLHARRGRGLETAWETLVGTLRGGF